MRPRLPLPHRICIAALVFKRSRLISKQTHAISSIMSDSDGDIGPQAPALPAAAKKRRVLDGETVLLEQVAFVTTLPSTRNLNRSFSAPICKHVRAVVHARRDSHPHSVCCWRLRHHRQQGAAAAVACSLRADRV
jgi:hypothetical protein